MSLEDILGNKQIDTQINEAGTGRQSHVTSFVCICQIKIKSTPRSIEQNGICQWCVRHACWRNVGQKIESLSYGE